MAELYPDSNFDGSNFERQTSGRSVDYDYDRVQVQADEEQGKEKFEKNDEKKRSVKIDLTQKTGALPDGTSNYCQI